MTPVYEWYQQGLSLLARGDAHAAATVLERAVAQEPEMGSLREALARAYFRMRRFRESLEQFATALDISPVNDYAHFGAGLCLGRLGRHDEAAGHLKLANAMRPGVEDYGRALRNCEAHRERLRRSGRDVL